MHFLTTNTTKVAKGRDIFSQNFVFFATFVVRIGFGRGYVAPGVHSKSLFFH
jgi:hypothetical protein